MLYFTITHFYFTPYSCPINTAIGMTLESILDAVDLEPTSVSVLADAFSAAVITVPVLPTVPVKAGIELLGDAKGVTVGFVAYT